tara:strand:+ start:327 stop:1454 length:1128 start_codon:yes stop_codon:yes gene_type:complete
MNTVSIKQTRKRRSKAETAEAKTMKLADREAEKIRKAEKKAAKQAAKKNKKNNVITNTICESDYSYFQETSTKDRNDAYNKKREVIICDLINKKIPEEFYSSPHWENLRQKLEICIQNEILPKLGIEDMESIWCHVKAGRNHSYDFLLKINDKECFLEFKYGSECVNDIPQIASLMKPSQYLEENFESYFYDDYLPKLAQAGNLTIPDKEEYLKTIHRNEVKCMEHFKRLSRDDETFKYLCRSIEKDAVNKFINEVDPKLSTISEYLKIKQKDKIYLLYKDGKFTTETVNEGLFQLVSVVERQDRCYVCETANGMKLSMRLRFKNGSSLQFPALDVKRVIPNMKQLQDMCSANSIQAPRLKKEILQILDEKGIVY